MHKPHKLRAHLAAHNAFLRANPDRLQVFVERGRIVCTGTNALAHEYRYTLTLLVTDYPESEDALMLPVLDWLRTNQPEVFENAGRRDDAVQFEVKFLTHETADIEIQLALTERVLVTRAEDGTLAAQHVGEPPHPFLPEEEP